MDEQSVGPNADYYWDIIESNDPDIWPGSIPWRDPWGSFGTLPDLAGFGGVVMRTRVPSEDIECFWADVRRRYPDRLPRFTVGPRETPGLVRWLQSCGYLRERSETLLVLNREACHDLCPTSDLVQEVAHVDDLQQVLALDHLVFGDPIPKPEAMVRELARLGPHRRLFYVPGEGIAHAAGGVTHYAGWSLLWGGETHPACRGQGLYHAILTTRLNIIIEGSAAFAAVYADNETSMPILRKAGFLPIGAIDVWNPVACDVNHLIRRRV